MSIREEIAKIVEQSQPSCGLPIECWTKCGECGAGRILIYLKAEIEKMENPYSDMVKYLIEHREEGDVNRGRREMAYAEAIEDILKLLEEK